ncbi:MAG: TrbC/VirB2 family protein [Burkholderiaceae bacterium]
MQQQHTAVKFDNFLRNPGWLLLGCVALAVAGGGGAGMPWDAPMLAFQQSITGPWAAAIALIAVVIAGAVLIFGGELNAFARTLIFIILVIAIIVGAAAFIGIFGAAGAVLPAI